MFQAPEELLIHPGQIHFQPIFQVKAMRTMITSVKILAKYRV